MILKLLRRLPLFRALESDLAQAAADLRESQSEKLVMRGRADAEYEARCRAEASLERAERELADWKLSFAAKDAEVSRLNALLIEEAHKVADTMSIHAIGKRFFSKAPDQAPGDVKSPLPTTMGRQFARSAQQNQTQSTRAALQKMWDSLPSESN